MWVLGDHRLMCGDSFSPADTAALVLQRPAALIVDPPYGMDLETDYSKIHNTEGFRHAPGVYEPVIGDDRPFDPRPLLEAFADVKEQWWWGADYYRSAIPDGGSWVVWDKRGVDGVGVFDPAIGNHFELAWSRQPHRREIARVLWSGHFGMQQEDTRKRLHPTQKPTALVRWILERWVPAGALVADLFGGSGTTLIACEQAGRPSAVMELSPAYCDVTLARWQRLTGHTPVLEATGSPHDFTP